MPDPQLELARQHYGMPVRDPAQPWPLLRWPTRPWRVAGRVRNRLRLASGRRRLAYVDSTFPWMGTGFRYHEAEQLLAHRPDTLFFSTWDLIDPFPVPVQSIADFPAVALRNGITDVYGVFQLFLEGLVGLGASSRNTGEKHFMEGVDLWPLLRSPAFRVHGAIYPGGGFVPTEENYTRLRTLAGRLDTTMSYVPEVLEQIPDAVAVPQAFTKTRFYSHTTERWQRTDSLSCLFAADAPPRKGADVAVEAFRRLGDKFHLHMAGPQDRFAGALPPERLTLHGWLSSAQLRDLHRKVHVFISPVRAEPPGPDGSYLGVTDGFPTQTAADAMSSGCLLVSANPAGDRRVLEPGVHYVECDADPERLAATLRALLAAPEHMRKVAQAGSAQVRQRMEIGLGVAAKLGAMGLI